MDGLVKKAEKGKEKILKIGGKKIIKKQPSDLD